MKHSPLVAVVGNPNAGKSALFNALTGARQKVGNYPGVTVERHVGRLTLGDGRPVELVDLPGAYGLDPNSPDEAVTRDVVMGSQAGERLPQAMIVVMPHAKPIAQIASRCGITRIGRNATETRWRDSGTGGSSTSAG